MPSQFDLNLYCSPPSSCFAITIEARESFPQLFLMKKKDTFGQIGRSLGVLSPSGPLFNKRRETSVQLARLEASEGKKESNVY